MSDENKSFSVLSPVDGDMLNGSDGTFTEKGFLTTVEILGSEGLEIYVNGRKAEFSEGIYKSDLLLSGYSNSIEVKEMKTGTVENIKVYVLRNFEGKYRLSIDDCIWFLRDLTQNSLLYKSLFDNPYLGFLKQVHDLYGTKIHMNIYYETEGFNLSEMTCKYKREWQENADWLRLSFHAFANDPDKPYKNSGYEKVKHDCEMVVKEIKRFAGEEVMGPVTTVHWGEATVEGCRALRDIGYKCFVGYFNVEKGLPVVSYYFNIDEINHIHNRFVWRDNREDIIFVRSSIVVNCHEKDDMANVLEKVKKDSGGIPYLDLLIHEQYFYPFYVNYHPDYREKILAAVKWAVDNSYGPAFIDECVFD